MDEALHPDFPVVSGALPMPNGWQLVLPVSFNRRIEDGSLVLWRPDLTFWINVWNNDHQLSAEGQLNGILEVAASHRTDEHIDRSGGLIRLTYELAESAPGGELATCRSISGYAISPLGYVQISAYVDSPEARTLGYSVIHSLSAKHA